MNILATQYSLKDKAFDIFVAGCAPPHCRGCHNPESWDFEQGREFDNRMALQMVQKLWRHQPMIDKIRIMGGEPLDQNLDELFQLLRHLELYCPSLHLWVFTKYTPEEMTPEQKEVLSRADFIKCGRYEEDLEAVEVRGITLASANQFIIPATEVFSSRLC